MASVPMIAPNFYQQWRAQNRPADILRESDEATLPTERLVQAIWLHQRLLRDRLQTSDGKSVRVLHPGFPNRSAGPDFREAVLQFGDEPARSGDVEVDLHSSGWRTHGHDQNLEFQK